MVNFITDLKHVAKEYVGEGLVDFITCSLEFVPYLGQLQQMRKFNRAERRIREHSDEFKRIQQHFLSGELPQEFIQERIGPIILSDLIEEHEDAKIHYLLNGFENVFIEKNTNESLIINYLDTLRQLRYIDAKYLCQFAHIEENDEKQYKKGSEEEALYLQIYTKLERLYLIKHPTTFGYLDFGAETDGKELNTELTKYGKNFVAFINKGFNLKVYEEILKNRKSPEDPLLHLKLTD